MSWEGRDQIFNLSWEWYWRTSVAEQKRPQEGEKDIGTFEDFSERMKKKWCMVAVRGGCISQVICQLSESKEGRVLPSIFLSLAQPYSFSLWFPNCLLTCNRRGERSKWKFLSPCHQLGLATEVPKCFYSWESESQVCCAWGCAISAVQLKAEPREVGSR